jgi:membrane protease YdiL (CAAX protease family)
MKKVLQNKWVSLLVLIVAFLLIYNPWTKFPFTFCVIIAFVLLMAYLQDGDFKSLNFKSIGLKEVKIIVICYLLLELSADFIFDPIINWACNETADYSAFSHIKGDTQSYFEWLLKMWISAAIGEELLFRGFVFTQLKRVIGDRKIIIVILSAVLFCIPHLYQGIVGLLSTFVFGIAFALIYMKFKNIWINIIVHGLIDTVFLTLSYLGMLEFYNFLK